MTVEPRDGAVYKIHYPGGMLGRADIVQTVVRQASGLEIQVRILISELADLRMWEREGC